MKKCMIVLLAVFTFALSANAQSAGVLEPVKWEFTTQHYGNGEFGIIATATIDENWHLYSQNIEDGGPIPTTFMFNPIEGVGEMKNITLLEKGEIVYDKYDELFEMRLKYFDEKVIFTQYFTTQMVREFTGYVEFMTCDDKRCLPPTMVEFSFILDPNQEVVPKPNPPGKEHIMSKGNMLNKKVVKVSPVTKPTSNESTAPVLDETKPKK